MDSRVPLLRREFRRVQDGKPRNPPPPADAEVREVIDALDRRGAWVDTTRGMRGFKKASREGVIESQTFAENVRLLCDFLAESKGDD